MGQLNTNGGQDVQKKQPPPEPCAPAALGTELGLVTHVGLDVHKKTICACMLIPGLDQPVEWTISNTLKDVRKMVKTVQKRAVGKIRMCYEAGPCGFVLQRQLDKLGIACHVVAPSLIPVKPGERIKTDRRDARKLALTDRAGLLTYVCPPTPEDEGLRDLCRAREDAKEDLLRARHHLSKLLLRQGHIWTAGRKAWTQAHARWMATLAFAERATLKVFEQYRLAITQVEERLKTLDAELAAYAESERYRTPVSWLRCFYGIDLVTAITLVAELHGFERFASARDLMAYLGLVPSEHSSGDSRKRGSITKAGNSHARRVLVEAAWHYRKSPAVSRALSRRREGQPEAAIAIADKAHQRLNRRYHRLVAQGKPPVKAVVAVARELAGFVWAVLHGYAKMRA